MADLRKYLCEFKSEGNYCDDCQKVIATGGDVYFFSDGGMEPRDGTYVCEACAIKWVYGDPKAMHEAQVQMLEHVLEQVKALGPKDGAGEDLCGQLSIALSAEVVPVWDPTRSYEAAIGIAEKLFPGCAWIIAKGKLSEQEPLFAAAIYKVITGEEELGADESDHSAPLAMTCAILKALIAKEKAALAVLAGEVE